MGEDSSRMAMTEQFVTVEAGERSMVLDAMALLGGNEYLVQQMIERLSETQYNEAEVAFIRASLSHTWGSVPPDLPGQFTLSQLLTFLTPLHRERLERLLASCLLYCSRYEDTKVMSVKSHAEYRMMTVNLHNIPGSDPPVGKTTSGETCSQLAILYHWSCPRAGGSGVDVKLPDVTRGPMNRGRKMSASLALEKKMLSIVDVIGVFPLPSNMQKQIIVDDDPL